MARLLPLTLTALLVSCSFAPIRVPIRDVTLPGNSSQGRVCYVKVTEGSRVGFRNATYRADATYRSSAPLGSNDVTIRVYGRESEPAGTCVTATDADVPLSEPLALRPGEQRGIEVGGPSYGAELAGLIVNETYWLGAALGGGTFLSLEERIELTNGVVSVYF